MLPLLLALHAYATEGATPDVAWVNAVLTRFNAHAHSPIPALSAKELTELSSGEVVRRLEHRDDGGIRVVAYLLSDVEPTRLWLSCQDPHFGSVDRLYEHRLAQTGPDRSAWYGLLDLPTPFNDRHWVVDVWNNHALAAATDGQAWEHPWTLREDGAALVRPLATEGALGDITPEVFDESIYTPLNEGAWITLEAPGGGTLLAYHVTSSVGGSIPDRLVMEFTMSTIEELLRDVERWAQETVQVHYVDGHTPIYSGAGEALSPLP